jgi:hypothetical protein
VADLTITSPAAVTAPAVNQLGTKLIVHGTITAGVTPLSCEIQKQVDSSPIASGDMAVAGALWWSRFGPLANVDGSTLYQVVATAPALIRDNPCTVKQLSFNPSIQVAFTPGTANQFPRQFRVSGTYLSGAGFSVSVYLQKPGTGWVSSGTVTYDQPQLGQWYADFNLNGSQSNCQLVAELCSPAQCVAADWIDGVNVG